jgi:hypothetical protein
MGKWKLTEELNDPGDGSGQFRPTMNTSDYVRFNTDSTFESNNSRFSTYNKFSVSNNQITFYSTNNTNRTTSRFDLNDKQLDLYNLCIERCAMRFKKS